jgi:UDP-glucose 6-dehydrogenase
MILQKPFYKLCIGTNLVNDNQYKTVLINNVIRECSTNLVHKAHLIWLNKNTIPVMDLQNFM